MKKNESFGDEYDAIIIGAGIGGLTCAAYLAKKGMRVKVFEQHSKPGGCCTSFSRKGFKFDVGVLRVTGGKESGALQRVLSVLEMENEIKFVERVPVTRLVFPNMSLDITRDPEDFAEKLKLRFPKEAEGISGLFDTMKSIYRDSKRLPILSPLLAKYKDRSFQELIDEYVTDPKLKTVAYGIWDSWCPMWQASAIDYASLFINEQVRGCFYPKGGIQAIPDAFVRVLRKYGGEIEFGTFVDKVILVNRKAVGIETRGGKRVRAAQIVSNIAARSTFLT